MKIAFTTSGGELDSPMDERFGRCASFLIFDPADGNCTAIANENCDAAGGAGIKAAETVSRAGANAVVTGECGPKASMALRQAGIRVYSFRGGSVREALELFLAGALPEAK